MFHQREYHTFYPIAVGHYTRESCKLVWSHSLHNSRNHFLYSSSHSWLLVVMRVWFRDKKRLGKRKAAQERSESVIACALHLSTCFRFGGFKSLFLEFYPEVKNDLRVHSFPPTFPQLSSPNVAKLLTVDINISLAIFSPLVPLRYLFFGGEVAVE